MAGQVLRGLRSATSTSTLWGGPSPPPTALGSPSSSRTPPHPLRPPPLHPDRVRAAPRRLHLHRRALVTGRSVTGVSQNVFANLGWDEIRLPAPVFEGDTIYSESEVLEKRESRSRPDVGIVTVKTTGYKQDGTVVITFKRTLMIYKRGRAPEGNRPTPNDRA